MQLFEVLSMHVTAWREDRDKHAEFSAIAEILEWAHQPDVPTFRLRAPQFFQPQVSDWRSMVDSVMIDSDYDGDVFNITLADVPEKKNDLVEGKYVIEAKTGATVAVKVTDMLGEEVLVVWEGVGQ
jgi:hypothetical protein